MFADKWVATFKKEKRIRRRGADVVTQQVRKMLQTADQKLILMVRG